MFPGHIIYWIEICARPKNIPDRNKLISKNQMLQMRLQMLYHTIIYDDTVSSISYVYTKHRHTLINK